ncbi:ATP-dependent RNA helicase DHX33-like [Monomorium pharaonis]|uniref:ATP-dependent RNA helicase DHX33-like n=1 Tax=Monomorium pharaonis TaxID=307658 RepID=UPI001747C6EF|nr:ATP-dependent RNA helicase DHX33-like [Monomorium pharaonis]
MCSEHIKALRRRRCGAMRTFCTIEIWSTGSEVRQQLAALAERANLEKASCGTNTKQLRKAFLEGLYENLAELQRDQTYVTVYLKQSVTIHPSSTLYGTKPPLLLFTEVVATGRCYLRGLSAIDPAWLTQKNIGPRKCD